LRSGVYGTIAYRDKKVDKLITLRFRYFCHIQSSARRNVSVGAISDSAADQSDTG
jgi:hypothetical protein